MRISDWSSDVCSSDLLLHAALAVDKDQDAPVLQAESGGGPHGHGLASLVGLVVLHYWSPRRFMLQTRRQAFRCDYSHITTPNSRPAPQCCCVPDQGDRKRVVEGKSGSERGELGGRRYYKKKT